MSDEETDPFGAVELVEEAWTWLHVHRHFGEASKQLPQLDGHESPIDPLDETDKEREASARIVQYRNEACLINADQYGSRIVEIAMIELLPGPFRACSKGEKGAHYSGVHVVVG